MGSAHSATAPGSEMPGGRSADPPDNRRTTPREAGHPVAGRYLQAVTMISTSTSGAAISD